jgi:hypothetical protein
MPRCFETFRQHGFDLEAALAARKDQSLYYHPLCGFATGEEKDIPEGWEKLNVPPGAFVSLAAGWGSIALADITMGHEQQAYNAAVEAARNARIAQEEMGLSHE